LLCGRIPPAQHHAFNLLSHARASRSSHPATNNWSDVQVISPCTGFMHLPCRRQLARLQAAACALLPAHTSLTSSRTITVHASAVCARGYKALWAWYPNQIINWARRTVTARCSRRRCSRQTPRTLGMPRRDAQQVDLVPCCGARLVRPLCHALCLHSRSGHREQRPPRSPQPPRCAYMKSGCRAGPMFYFPLVTDKVSFCSTL
jgi:hypothetical protein